MPLSNIDKNLLICTMERSLADAKEAAEVSALSEIETAVSDLRTAYGTDPATVTAQNLVDASTKISNLSFPSLDNVRAVITEAQQEAAQG